MHRRTMDKHPHLSILIVLYVICPKKAPNPDDRRPGDECIPAAQKNHHHHASAEGPRISDRQNCRYGNEQVKDIYWLTTFGRNANAKCDERNRYQSSGTPALREYCGARDDLFAVNQKCGHEQEKGM